MNRWTKARKTALEYLGLDVEGSMSYSDIAKRIAFKEFAIIEDLDLSNRLHARAMLLAWSYRHEALRQRLCR